MTHPALLVFWALGLQTQPAPLLSLWEDDRISFRQARALVSKGPWVTASGYIARSFPGKADLYEAIPRFELIQPFASGRGFLNEATFTRLFEGKDLTEQKVHFLPPDVQRALLPLKSMYSRIHEVSVRCRYYTIDGVRVHQGADVKLLIVDAPNKALKSVFVTVFHDKVQMSERDFRTT